MNLEYYLYLLVSYGFSIIIGHFFIHWVMSALRRKTGDERVEKSRVLSPIQGSIERTLYTASWQLQFPEFIAVWMALKVASQWKKWSEAASYHIFLIGTGLSVIFAVVGAKLREWLILGWTLKVIIYPGILILICIFIIIYLEFSKEGKEKS